MKYKVLNNKNIVYIILIILLISIKLLFFNNATQITVLVYHHFLTNNEKEKFATNNGFVVTTENFEKQMAYLKKHNWKTLSMEEFYCWMKNKCETPKKSILITIDDGNISTYLYALPILEKYNLKATAFLITSRVATTTPV